MDTLKTTYFLLWLTKNTKSISTRDGRGRNLTERGGGGVNFLLPRPSLMYTINDVVYYIDEYSKVIIVK
jgi:hypothetical protein